MNQSRSTCLISVVTSRIPPLRQDPGAGSRGLDPMQVKSTTVYLSEYIILSIRNGG
jgi:hypothetical protein